MIEKIMTNVLNTVLPELIPAKRKIRALTAMIESLSGKIMLAVENINFYLWKRITELMAKAVRKPANSENGFLMYGQLNLESIKK